MEVPHLSRLVTVDPRDVWLHEAHSFTPWLLANADALGDAIGMDLELTAAEHSVGGFSLDLIGRDVATDTVVIVENQLEQTNHSHLGQLLTYAGGTDAATVVWVATSFRDEHRSALDWLNANTHDGIRFFGVVVGAVTLAGAPAGLVAPRFELVAKPNDWGKKVKSTAAHGGSGTVTSEKEKLYEEFWGQWLADAAAKNWTSQGPQPKNWLYLPSGLSGTRFVVSFRGDGLLSELYLSHSNPAVNEARLHWLHERQDVLEQTYGRPLIFDTVEGKKGCRLGEWLTSATITDKDHWPEFRAFLLDAQTRLRAALAAVGGVAVLAEVTVTAEGDIELLPDYAETDFPDG